MIYNASIDFFNFYYDFKKFSTGKSFPHFHIVFHRPYFSTKKPRRDGGAVWGGLVANYNGYFFTHRIAK